MQNDQILSWVHFGDLHMTCVGAQNHVDFGALVVAANRYLAGAVDFAVLPGDNADDGTAGQFKTVAEIAGRLSIPLHVLPGDHDFKQNSLKDFYQYLAAEILPFATSIKGFRCLFLDVVSHGSGGPDFRLDESQLSWVAAQLIAATKSGEDTVVFMHTYPADLQAGRIAMTKMLRGHGVLMVDMGHTHYNELSNDGCTIFAATRSTGQIEEDSVGFSTAVIDRGVASWRFKPLASPWPWVQITSPADHRLITNVQSAQQIIRGSFSIHAKVWDDVPIDEVKFEFGDSIKGLMIPVPEEADFWQADIDGIDSIPDSIVTLSVQARDVLGNVGGESLRVLVKRDGKVTLPQRSADGSDRDSVGAWPEKGIMGTQLGPNRNEKKW